MMPVGFAGGEADAVAGDERLLAVVGDQDDLACQHHDEFVLVRMPMALARPRAGAKRHLVHAELREPGGAAETNALAVLARLVER